MASGTAGWLSLARRRSEEAVVTCVLSVLLWTVDLVVLTVRCSSRPTVWHGGGVEPFGRIVKRFSAVSKTLGVQ